MDILGDYVLHEHIGDGATGKVHHAEDRRSGKRVALKVLHAELTRTPESRRHVVEELRLLTALVHPGAAQCFECREIDGHVVLAYELVDGLTLRARLKRGGRMAWSDAARIGTQIAEALAGAHELVPPIVHRDLRPANVMVGTNGAVKVMDFGIAKVLGAAGQTTTATFGNITYMSPEQIDAFGIDPRSDLYCLGLVLYEIITGDVPFKGSPRDLLNAQCTQPPPPFPASLQMNVPADLESVIRWMLEKSPDARPVSAREVSRMLQAVLAGQPIAVPAGRSPSVAPAPTPPSIPPASTPSRPSAPIAVAPKSSTSGGLVAVLAIVALVLLLGGGVMAYLALSPDTEGSSDVAATLPPAKGKTSKESPVDDPKTSQPTPTDPPANDDGSSVDPIEVKTTADPDDGGDDIGGDGDDGGDDDGGDDGPSFDPIKAIFSDSAQGQAPVQDPAVEMLLGSHVCGIHWLQRRGTCEVTQEGETLRISGSQKSSGDSFKLSGTVEVKDDRTFVVKGSLNSRVSSCCGTRNLSGKFTFKRSGKRKYWRLQNPKRICDPFKVCMYYVDIFMKKGEE